MPEHLLSLPAVVQAFILTILACESAFGLFGDAAAVAVPLIFLLISAEGICGGLA